MDNSIISNLAVGIFTLLGVFITNQYQAKRDTRKFKQDLALQKFNEENLIALQNKKTLEQQLTRAHYLLSMIKQNISLTESVITSTSKISDIEFDKKYKQNLELVFEFKGIICTFFTDLISTTDQVVGFHNNFWGNQRILNKIDPKTEFDRFQSLQNIVNHIGKECDIHFDKLHDKLVELSPYKV